MKQENRILYKPNWEILMVSLFINLPKSILICLLSIFFSAPYFFSSLYITGSQYHKYNECLASFHGTLQLQEIFIKNKSSFETIITY